jgi:hypothetical protein
MSPPTAMLKRRQSEPRTGPGFGGFGACPMHAYAAGRRRVPGPGFHDALPPRSATRPAARGVRRPGRPPSQNLQGAVADDTASAVRSRPSERSPECRESCSRGAAKFAFQDGFGGCCGGRRRATPPGGGTNPGSHRTLAYPSRRTLIARSSARGRRAIPATSRPSIGRILRCRPIDPQSPKAGRGGCETASFFVARTGRVLEPDGHAAHGPMGFVAAQTVALRDVAALGDDELLEDDGEDVVGVERGARCRRRGRSARNPSASEGPSGSPVAPATDRGPARRAGLAGPTTGAIIRARLDSRSTSSPSWQGYARASRPGGQLDGWLAHPCARRPSGSATRCVRGAGGVGRP